VLIYPPPPPINTLSLHDALPIFRCPAKAATLLVSHASGRASAVPRTSNTRQRNASSTHCSNFNRRRFFRIAWSRYSIAAQRTTRSEEHTSELQSLAYLVCRLLLE